MYVEDKKYSVSALLASAPHPWKRLPAELTSKLWRLLTSLAAGSIALAGRSSPPKGNLLPISWPRRARWFHVLLIEPRTLAVTLMALVALVALMATLLLVGEVWQVTLVHLGGHIRY